MWWMLCALCVAANEPSERTVVHPKDNGEALENPSMGWVFHHFDNSIHQYGPPLGPSYCGQGFPGLNVAYLRLAWSYLEPEEDVYDWSLVDGVAQRYIEAGRKIAFRFTCFESGDVYATPRWLKEKGVQGRWFRYGKGVVDEDEPGATWEPDYDDPLFLERLDRFLGEAAKRYDDNPSVAFLDIGSIGIWGEGNPCTRKYTLEMYKTHVHLHFKHFKNTLLVGMDDWRPLVTDSNKNPRQELLDMVRALGGTLRDDPIIYKKGFRFLSKELAQDFWPTRPVILESGHYWSNDWSDGADQDYFDAIEAYHASYISIHGPPDRIWKDHANIIREMNRRIGYRIQLIGASWPEKIVTGKPFCLETEWRNAGVAPCYPGGVPAFTLKDSQGNIRAVWTAPQFNARRLEIGPPGKAPSQRLQSSFRTPPNAATGSYEIFVSLGERDGTPRIALPLGDGDGQRRYRVGEIQIRFDGEYRLLWGDLVQRDGSWELPVTFEILKPLPQGVQPFGHLDFEGRIVKGLPFHMEKDASSLQKPGKVRGDFQIVFPEDAEGRVFPLRLGLWVYQGRRIVPENGMPDLRIDVGTAQRTSEGKISFQSTRIAR